MTDVMTKPELALQLEGTWEEILAHAPELAGRRVRVVVLPDAARNEADTANENALQATLSPENQRLLVVLDELRQTPWTEEEMAVLDGFEQFNRDNPLTFDWQPTEDI